MHVVLKIKYKQAIDKIINYNKKIFPIFYLPPIIFTSIACAILSYLKALQLHFIPLIFLIAFVVYHLVLALFLDVDINKKDLHEGDE